MIKGTEKTAYKKELVSNSTPSLFPISQYFMSTITVFIGKMPE